MFAQVAVLAVLASSAAVSAAPTSRRDAPAGWASGYLEKYDAYHTRYLALDCQDQHNSTFFDECCHPLLATESLTDRPVYCTPNATANATAAAEINGTAWNATSIDVSECFNDTESAVSSVIATATGNVNQAAIAAAIETTSTSTSETPAWTPASTTSTSETPAWTPASTTSEAPAQTSSAPSGGNTVSGGFATYFYQNGVAGSCGTVHSDSDYVAAMSSYGSYNEYCGRQISITNTNNGKSVTVTVADTCPTCVNSNSIDLSSGAFQAIASESDGMVPISWQFV